MISGAIGLLTVLRVLVNTEFDAQTAYLLLSVADRTQLLYSSAIDLFLLASSVAVAIAFLVVVKKVLPGDTLPDFRPNLEAAVQGHSPSAWVARSCFLLLVGIGVWTTPFFLLAYGPVIAIIMIARSLISTARSRIRKGSVSEANPRWDVVQQFVRTWVMAGMLAYVLLVFMDTSWRPHESITLKGTKPQAALVYGEKDGRIFAWGYRDGWIWTDTKLVEERSLCDYGLPDLMWRSFADYSPIMDLPDCP